MGGRGAAEEDERVEACLRSLATQQQQLPYPIGVRSRAVGQRGFERGWIRCDK